MLDPVIQDGEATTALARIPLYPGQHKLRIAIFCAVLLATSCILPLAGFFSLYYTHSLKTTSILAIFSAIFGANSVFAFVTRLARLLRNPAAYGPVGATSRWALDTFMWNFVVGFVYITALVSAGCALATTPRGIRLASLPLALLVAQVSAQMVLLRVAGALGARLPFRASSFPRGSEVPSVVFVILEDTMAVDAGLGVRLREALLARYRASPVFRRMMVKLDWMWGLSGLVVAAGVFAVVFAVTPNTVGYGVGWAVPWIWGGVMALVTVVVVKSDLRREAAGMHTLQA